jgi:hypothetical protein
MRGNGLSADTYVAVADLDPTTADVLLAELRDRGVAAYAADSPEPGPRGPVDRLYVDAAAEDQARTMIDEQLSASAALPAPGPAPTVPAGPGAPPAVPPAPHDAPPVPGEALDYDAAFADIVAGFDSPSSAVGRWSADEDVTTDPDPAFPASPALPTGAASSHVGWDDVLRPEPPTPPEAEDRYVPPPPPPLPHASRRTLLAWVGVTGGPAVLFAAAIFGWQLEDLVLLVAVVAFLAGFVALVAGLKDTPQDGDGDDGAVL